MCRNAMCENFGVHYTGETPTREKPVAHDANYRLHHTENRAERTCQIRCKRCGQSFHLRNNRAVYPLARHFISLSLPFADCPDEQCKSHEPFGNLVDYLYKNHAVRVTNISLNA